MGEKNDDLGLSLGLGCGPSQPSSPSPPFLLNLMQTPSETNNTLFGFSADRNAATSFRSFVREIDVNHAASADDVEDENGVSSPNSTVSSQSGKRSEREATVGGGDENEAERTSSSRGGSEDEDGGGGEGSKKKLRLTKEQSLLLEDNFKEHHTLNTRQKQELAQQLNLSARQVEVWFQNRRARTKLKQTEVDCDQLRKCCENLTEENRRLQKEVQELRALKLSPQLYMQMSPPTTLTMCPSCQCVGVSSAPCPAAATGTSSSGGPRTAATRHSGEPNVHRTVPISPWATLPIPQHRSGDAPATTSRS